MSVWGLDARKLRRERGERVIRDLRGREMKDLRCKEFSLWVRDKSGGEFEE